MSNVVSLFESEPLVWVCKCGCSTFRLYEGGAVECASCGVIGPEGGEWINEVPEPPMVARQQPIETKVISIAGNDEQALNSMLVHADAKTMVAAIFIYTNNRVRVWGGIDDNKRIRWLARRLKDARELLTICVRGHDG